MECKDRTLFLYMIFPYEFFIEEEMKEFYRSLSEDRKRRYAAMEATRAGYGGVKYISKLFGCSPRTIYNGQQELEAERTKKNRKNLQEE